MIRRTALVASILSGALAASTVSGCKVQMSSKTGDNPPPAPSAAPAAPAPTAEAPPPAETAAPPAETPKPAEPSKPKEPIGKVEQKGAAIQLPGNIVFDFDKATLTPNSGSEEVLEQLKNFMVENEKKLAAIRVEGYTDNQGTPEHNLELSGQRALTIKRWLTSHGIEESRVVAVGFGQDKPVVPNTTDENRAENRRTEFKVAMIYDKKGKPQVYLGGKDALGGGKEFK